MSPEAVQCLVHVFRGYGDDGTAFAGEIKGVKTEDVAD
jgi:hypothetical protein